MSVRILRFDVLEELDAALADWIGLQRLAVFTKLSGDYDDGTRERQRAALDALLGRTVLGNRAVTLSAVGCEGVATPFGYALAVLPDEGGSPPRLAIGLARGGRGTPAGNELAWVDAVAASVTAALADAALTSAQAVQAFVKVPSRAARAIEERVRGRRARAIGALGSAVALGEITRAQITPERIATDLALYGTRTQAFGGPEIEEVEVVVLGNRAGAGGDLVAVRAVMADLIDVRALKRMLVGAGLALDTAGELEAPERVAAFFAKCGPTADGRVRGAPTSIYGSSIPPEKHMRAAQSGLLGALLGTTRFFNTGDPIHQAPDGGGIACAIVSAYARKAPV